MPLTLLFEVNASVICEHPEILRYMVTFSRKQICVSKFCLPKQLRVCPSGKAFASLWAKSFLYEKISVLEGPHCPDTCKQFSFLLCSNGENIFICTHILEVASD